MDSEEQQNSVSEDQPGSISEVMCSAAKGVLEGGDSLAVADMVSSAVTCIFSPESSPENRVAAHEILENFKDNSEICAEVGFWLAKPENSIEIRHFGLQAVEHAIKFRWSDFTPEKRVMIKYNCEELIARGLGSVSDEAPVNNLIKEGLAKCIVEMAKREWPQNWPRFLDDCEKFISSGPLIAEIVFLTLLRLTQDVVTINTMTNLWRKRELHNTIVTNLPKFLEMSLNVLKSYKNHCDMYVSGSKVNHLCQVVLEFLGEFLEWTPSKNLSEIHGELYSVICRYLDHNLSMHAAVCFWQIASRNDSAKADDFKPCMALFGTEYLTAILNATKTASDNSFDSENYVFLKTLTAILVAMGNNLARIWGKGGLQGPPDNFDLYMKAIVAFLEHPSLYIRNQASTVLAAFSHTPEILESECFKASLPAILESIAIVAQKRGFPSMSDCPTCDYSKLDYETDADFIVEHTLPLEEWDCMVRYFRGYFEQLSKEEMHFKSLVVQNKGTALINGILKILMAGNSEWKIVDQQLSLLSTLLVFLPSNVDRLPTIVEMIFKLLRTEVMDNPDIENVKMHCLNILINLSVDYSEQLLPIADLVLSKANEVGPVMNLTRKAKLLETLCSLSNHFGDFDKQKQFLLGTVWASLEFWKSKPVTDACANPDTFLKHIGLTDEAPKSDEVAATMEGVQNRMNLLGHLSVLEAVLTRVALPKKPCAENFLTADGRIMHPAFEGFSEIFPVMFMLCRCLNGIYNKSVIAKIHPSYGGVSVLDLPESEKQMVYSASEPVYELSAQGAFKKKTNACHVKTWISNITEKAQLLVGLFGQKFSWQFYSLEAAGQYLRVGCLGFLEDCLDLRLRSSIKKTWRLILSSLWDFGNWHTEYFPVVEPSFSYLIQHVYQRLSLRWETIIARKESEQEEKEYVPSAQETFMEDVTCVLTRDYMMMLSLLMYRGHLPNLRDISKHEFLAKVQEVVEQQMEDATDEMPKGTIH